MVLWFYGNKMHVSVHQEASAGVKVMIRDNCSGCRRMVCNHHLTRSWSNIYISVEGKKQPNVKDGPTLTNWVLCKGKECTNAIPRACCWLHSLGGNVSKSKYSSSLCPKLVMKPGLQYNEGEFTTGLIWLGFFFPKSLWLSLYIIEGSVPSPESGKQLTSIHPCAQQKSLVWLQSDPCMCLTLRVCLQAVLNNVP